MRLIPTQRGILRALLLCVVLTPIPTVASAQDPALVAEFDARTRGDSLAVLSALNRGAADSASAILGQIVPRARATGDSARVARALLVEASFALRRGNVADAAPRIAAARRLAERAGNDGAIALSLRAESVILNMKGQSDRTEPLVRRWTALARKIGDAELLAWGATTRGFARRVKGDVAGARAQLAIAGAIFDSLGHSTGRAFVANDVGRLDIMEGKYEEARAHFERVLTLCEPLGDGDPRVRDYALNNLGVIETRSGDPVRAIGYNERSIAGKILRGETPDVLVTYSNIVTASTDLGRTEQALALGRQALALAERDSVALEIPWARHNLGEALWAAGVEDSAQALFRAVLADPAAEPSLKANSQAGLARALAAHDSLLAAAREYESALVTYGPRLEAEARVKIEIELAKTLLRAGQADRVPPRLEPIAGQAERSSDEELGILAYGVLAQAYRSLGRTADAERALARGTTQWEKGRDASMSYEIREHRGEQARQLLVESVALARGDEAAFAAVQRMKTRTLLERVSRPNAPVAAFAADEVAFDPAAFRRDVLRDGEVFLEYVLGADTTFLFVVTKDAVRRVGLPGEVTLAPQVRLARDAFATRPQAGAEAATAARVAGQALGRTLLGPASAEIARGGTLIVAPDGVLHRVPFGALVVGGGETPLAASRRLAIAPSGAFLAALRTRGTIARAGGANAAEGLLAIGGGRRAIDGADELVGARREIDELVARFGGVTARYAGDDGRVAFTTGELASFSGLHFAGHSTADDQLPWRSGIVLGPAATGGDSLLTAGELAAAPIGSRLVVLSSCESAGGRARAGEGVAGLTTAFLVAGAPTVVATLWPVDDRVTVRLMERFYRGLASGRTAADALKDAQDELRADAATAHPSWWAGFVLVGEPTTTFPLTAKAGPSTLTGWAIAAVLASLAAVLLWRLQRRTTTQPGET